VGLLWCCKMRGGACRRAAAAAMAACAVAAAAARSAWRCAQVKTKQSTTTQRRLPTRKKERMKLNLFVCFIFERFLALVTST
jgi:hypothetical protein